MAQQQPSGGPKLEAISDVTYDIVTELCNAGRAVDSLDTYIDDAKRDNDSNAQRVFEQIREDKMRHADMLKCLICDEVNRGKF